MGGRILEEAGPELVHTEEAEAARAKWIEALRSGKYPQAQGRLRKPLSGVEGYCCLGVACDLYREDHPGSEWTPGGTFRASAYGPEESSSLLDPVQRWLGISNLLENELIGMNDDGASFEEIAAFIEGSA